ncbi:MAG: TlpA disulfide reductase family protein [Pyrinomonadaceae bacterium]
MKQNAQILSLILLTATLAILPACKSNTAQIGNIKKGPVDETVQTNAAPQTSPNTAQKTYKLPEEVTEAELKTLDGKNIKISDFKGKVVLINLWATWCGPCRMEIPELIKISEDMKGQGVEIIGMTAVDDRGNNENSVKAFVKEQNVPYQIIWGSDDVTEELSNLGNFSIPASFVLNRDGEVTAIFRGFNPKRTPQSVRKSLEDALLNNQSQATVSEPPTNGGS